MMNRKTLVYAGAHLGGGLSSYIYQYDVIYAFEANPKFCEELKRRYSSIDKDIRIVNAALCESHGSKVQFNISSNNGDSSSILAPNKENCLFDLIKPSETVVVDGMNLATFLNENGVAEIDCYVSDLQGYDFTVLNTMTDFIRKSLIKTIQCEVAKKDKVSIYEYGSIAPNTEENFNSLLADKYEKVATGWGNLQDGVFNEVPSDWSEWDIRWKLKTA